MTPKAESTSAAAEGGGTAAAAAETEHVGIPGGSLESAWRHEDDDDDDKDEDKNVFSQHARSMDEFLEEAHAATSWRCKWQYWLMLLSLALVACIESMTLLNLNFVLSDATFEAEVLHDNYRRVGAMVSAAMFAGMLVGGIGAGVGGDAVGRRPILVGGSLVNAIFASGAVVVGHSAVGLGTCRFLCGLGIGAITSANGAHVAEASPPSRRGLHSTLAGAFWTVGSLYAAVIAICIFNTDTTSSSNDDQGHDHDGAWWAPWRSYLLATALPCVVSALFIWKMVPESARYLVTQGRYEEATLAANQLAQAMGYVHQERWLQLSEVVERHGGGGVAESTENPNDKHAIPHMRNTTTTTTKPYLLSSIAVLFGRELRSRTLPSQWTYFSLAFGTALTGWITTILKSIPGAVGQNAYWISCFVVVANVPGTLVAAVFMDRLSRRFMLSTSMWASALALALLAIVTRQEEGEEEEGDQVDNSPEDKHKTRNAVYYSAVVLSACAFHSFISISWFTMTLWATELLPTSVRTTGMGVMAGFGRVAGVMSQFLSGILMDAHRPAVLLGLASVSVALGAMGPFVLTSSMLETSGTQLTDTVGDATAVVVDESSQPSRQRGNKIRRRSGGRRYAAAPQQAAATSGGTTLELVSTTTTRRDSDEFVRRSPPGIV